MAIRSFPDENAGSALELKPGLLTFIAAECSHSCENAPTPARHASDARTSLSVFCRVYAASKVSMSTALRLCRGPEIYPLVFPHPATEPGRARNYDEGFDAAVCIQEPGGAGEASRSHISRISVRALPERRRCVACINCVCGTPYRNLPIGTNVFDLTS